MKIKHHQQHYLNNSNNSSGLAYSSSGNQTTPPTHSNTMTSSNNSTFLLTSPTNMTDLHVNGSNANFFSAGSSSNNANASHSAIWTRSAAFKAAQQDSSSSSSQFINETQPLTAYKQRNNHLNSSHHHNHHSHHHHHHGQYQHVLGKIVKPIPVRPMSSSSSSSSTHSSLFNSSNLTGVVLLANKSTTLPSSNQTATAAVHSAETTDFEIDNTSNNININNNSNFSLIAKYFASFPATRLKSTSSASNNNNNNIFVSGNGNSDTVAPPHVCPHHMHLHHLHHHHHHHHSHLNTHNHYTQSPMLGKPSDSVFMSSTNQETTTPTQLVGGCSNKKSSATTFMPFKKSSTQLQNNKSHTTATTAAATTTAITNSPAATNTFHLNDSTNNTNEIKIQSTFILRSQSASHQTANKSSMPPSSNLITNTDHLCTNFKRMIKLSDTNNIVTSQNNAIESGPASPLTAASNTPTFIDNTNDLTNTLTATPSAGAAFSDSTHNTFTFPNFEYDASFTLPIDLGFSSMAAANASVSNGGNNETRFGQITMETRSTRKFLIKHHPYLQLNSNINNNSINTNKLFNQQRPSINLIKMKKLISKSSNRSSKPTDGGRLSQTNELDDSRLLKFTDTAPQIVNSSQQQQLNQSTYSLRVKQSSTSSSFKTSNKVNKSKKSSTSNVKSLTEETANSAQKLADDWCCCMAGGVNSETYLESHECDNCFEEYDDGQEEDSSGYYSSYHSVDLVSSSGGGSIIGDKKQEVKTLIADQLNKPTNINTQPSPQQQTPVPQHHYHTRYLSNFLQQTNQSPSATTTNQRPITTTPLSASSSKTSISNSNTTPTTRLRYQQQLAAAAATSTSSKSSPTHMKPLYYSVQHQQHALNSSSRFHEQYQLECDLDLDQIEND